MKRSRRGAGLALATLLVAGCTINVPSPEDPDTPAPQSAPERQDTEGPDSGQGGQGGTDEQGGPDGQGGSAPSDPDGQASPSEEQGEVPQTAPPPQSTPGDLEAPPAASEPGTTAEYTPQEFYSDYYTAIQVVNSFWTQHWSESFTGVYTPPGFVTGSPYGEGMYDGTVDTIHCGPTAEGTYSTLEANNAYYCGAPYSPTTDYVAFDVNFLWRAREYGDMFVYMIVAHEWGHSIQGRLDSTLVSVAAELQADCLAGATLNGAIADGTLVIDESDPSEVPVGLTGIADSYPWGKVGDHGDPDERIANFTNGWNNGVSACVS
jgi:predicted metalloprotease